MRKPVIIGSALLMTALVVGCGGSSDDAVMKEQIAVFNEMTTILEKVTDAQSLKDADKKMEALKKRSEESAAKIKNWSADQKKAMEQKYDKELKAAAEKMAVAFGAATMKAMGGGLDKLKLPPLP